MPQTAFYAYRLLARFAEILPLSAVQPVSRFAGAVGATLSPTRRRAVEDNLHHVLGRRPAPKLVKAAFASYCRYWLESLRLPVVPVEQLEALVRADHAERLDQALANGKGAILALPHTGNWDMGGAWLVHRGVPVTVVAEVLEPPKLHRWFTDFRNSLGLQVEVNGPNVGAALLTALARNEIVGLLCDRDVDGTGGEYEFFGEVTKLPKGPATLALRSGAALIPVAVFEDGPGYLVHVDEPIDTQRKERLSADVDRVTKDLARSLESLIARHPEQWHVFQPNW